MYKLQLPPDCPLTGAAEQTIDLYRLIGGETLTDGDLLSHVERYPDRFATHCLAHGLSFFKTLKSAREANQGAANRQKPLGTHIAKVRVKPEHGKLYAKDKDDHCTLWLYSDTTAEQLECLAVRKVEACDGTDGL